jgi:hypothetical protein
LACVATAQEQPKDTAAKPKAEVKQAAFQGAAAPQVVLISGERVESAEAMAFTRNVLLREGEAYAAMSRLDENISSVRFAIENYRAGYSLAAAKEGERHYFNGPTKGWRAESTAGTSTWPPVTNMAQRREAMRRAKLLQPILIAEPIDEMNNLRLYYLPGLAGHDGQKYVEEPMVIAFFIHTKSGTRMTVLLRGGRAYGSVGRALSATSNIYVHSTTQQSAGPLGLAEAHIPDVFYAKSVRMDMEPFSEGDSLERLMVAVLAAHQNGPLSTADFRALYKELTRYTQ